MKQQYGQTCPVQPLLTEANTLFPLKPQITKKKATVCLTAKVDDTKMKPYVVIPAAKVNKELAYIPGVVVAAMRNR